ncbi:metal-binding protein [Kaistia sp. 32K]|uniref:YceD family protein n=1 Tax=Kaistia sp. 32K TaxID=2795690 RepID=UPI001916508D|nr:DUF177 domain-containing protein [Kaistia sp. 32K]BCP53362.1 metal-binding protein [Kaistia sp. 32K]
MTELSLTRSFDVSHLGNVPQNQHVVAGAAERLAIQREFDLLDLTSFAADLVVAPWGQHGVKIDGRLRADLVQACVITLQPVPSHMDHRFSLSFLPADAIAADPKTVAEAEVIVVYDEEDPPEPLEDNTIDFGAILTEQFALALDPYPRAPGATLSGGEEPVDNADSPFAALSKLRDK